MRLFVDSSVLYAAVDDTDEHHRRATELLSASDGLVTTDHVLVETWLLIRPRGSRAGAERFWQSIRAGAATVETVLPVTFSGKWRRSRGT